MEGPVIDTLFVMDPLERINVRGDSTFMLMLEGRRRGWPCSFCTPSGLYALGEVEAGAAITALNTFTPATAVASLVGSAVTAFIEGRFNFAVDVYELVTA